MAINFDNNDIFEEDDVLNIGIVLSKDDSFKQLQEGDLPKDMPILPIKNNVILPDTVIPIIIGRKKSIKLIEDAHDKKISFGVFTQIDDDKLDPGVKDLYEVGMIADVLKMLQMPDGNLTAIIRGKQRIKIDSIISSKPYLRAKVSLYNDDFFDKDAGDITKAEEEDTEEYALLVTIRDLVAKMAKLSPNAPKEIIFASKNTHQLNALVYMLAANVPFSKADKQELLEKTNIKERAYLLMSFLMHEIQVLELKHKVQKKVNSEISKQQKEYILGQELKTIQEELGTASVPNAELDNLREKAKKKKWSKEVKEYFDTEFLKMSRINTMSPEYSTQLNYLNVMVDLPWGVYTSDKYNLTKVRGILDKDHFGLEKVKDRIVSYLAVLQLRGDMKSPILCLYGPPGTGKTSLGRSVAEAMGRKYVRISLGGLHDESEIRGHRKTYIGAMPGRIIQSMKKAQSSNPVFLLDEIDKVNGMTVNGDPSAALLEVLDPEQNTDFHDNYLDVDYDLSNVLFIATANSVSEIHPALLDRMELIHVPGYTLEEKLQIAKKHLLPKQLHEHGLGNKDIVFSEANLKEIIANYTSESGVRQLEKRIASVIRAKAVDLVVQASKGGKSKAKAEGRKGNKTELYETISTLDVPRKVDSVFIRKALGIKPIIKTSKLKKDTVGVATGLAWTSNGGEILFIEASLTKGKGELSLTGNLGNVMKESVTLAYKYIKSNANVFDIDIVAFENSDIHIHVPEGATPKDGPSAGIAIFSAMFSVFTQKKVKANLAMTGEITLRGAVMPVGGIREKILAAKRANITNIILCSANKADIEDIPQNYIEDLSIQYIDKVEELVSVIFC